MSDNPSYSDNRERAFEPIIDINCLRSSSDKLLYYINNSEYFGKSPFSLSRYALLVNRSISIVSVKSFGVFFLRCRKIKIIQ